MMRWAARHFLRDNRAAAAVEMALILPMAFALLFTCFEGGSYMWNEHKVVKAVREGARYAGRQSFAHFSCGSAAVGTTSIDTAIKNMVRTGSPDASKPPRIAGWSDNDDITITVSCDSGITAGIYDEFTGGAPRVLVSAVVAYPSLFGAFGFDTAGLNVRAQSQAAVMGL